MLLFFLFMRRSRGENSLGAHQTEILWLHLSNDRTYQPMEYGQKKGIRNKLGVIVEEP